MGWLRIDDRFADDPDIIELGNEAAGAFVRLLAYCSKHATDGLIPRPYAAMISPKKVLDSLASRGLLVEAAKGETFTVTGRRDSGRRHLDDVTVIAGYDSYFVPKYLHYNTSAEERARRAGRDA